MDLLHSNIVLHIICSQVNERSLDHISETHPFIVLCGCLLAFNVNILQERLSFIYGSLMVEIKQVEIISNDNSIGVSWWLCSDGVSAVEMCIVLNFP